MGRPKGRVIVTGAAWDIGQAYIVCVAQECANDDDGDIQDREETAPLVWETGAGGAPPRTERGIVRDEVTEDLGCPLGYLALAGSDFVTGQMLVVSGGGERY
jgi:hypothetical protein